MALPAIAIVLLALVTATPSFAQLCRLGEEKWVTACSVELNTGRHGSARTCTGSPPPGFVMVEWKAQTDSVKNGDIALSAIQGQRYDWKEQIVILTRTFYTTGMEHSPASATGTAWEQTPWRAVQQAAWEAMKDHRRLSAR